MKLSFTSCHNVGTSQSGTHDAGIYLSFFKDDKTNYIIYTLIIVTKVGNQN